MANFENGSIITKNGKRFSLTQILRHGMQIGAFLLFPGLFLTVFHAMRDLVVSIINGSFSFSSQAPGLVTLLIVFAVTALWGRFFCGYLCSFGAVQDLLASVSRKLAPKRKGIPAKADRILKYLKYAVLSAIVLFVWVLQLPVDSSFSPWGVFGMILSGNGSVMLSAIPSFGFLILAAILTASFFVERFFCRYLCPLGALFTPVSKGRLFRIHRIENACSGCRQCSRACTMGITLHEKELVTSGECIDCMRCMGVCAPAALRANPHPAIAGTATALVLYGTLGVSRLIPAERSSADPVASAAEPAGNADRYADGVYTGSGTGFRGTISSQVTVQYGRITDITTLSYRDDSDYFSRAQSGVISAILSSQTPQVDAVSGATFSSYGIMESVADALQLVEVRTAVAEQSQNSEQNGHQTVKQHHEGEVFTMQPEGESVRTGKRYGGKGGESRLSGHPGGRPLDGSTDDTEKHGTSQSEEGSHSGRKHGGRSGKSDGRTSGTPDSPDHSMKESPEEKTFMIIPSTPAQEEAQTSEEPSSFTDGTYTGRGTGFRGDTEVSVTVKDGKITDITVLSYSDDRQYFSRASNSMIEAILNSQSLRVSTVSGATFSSNGILEAVADALDLTFSNPNASAGGHGRH